MALILTKNPYVLNEKEKIFITHLSPYWDSPSAPSTRSATAVSSTRFRPPKNAERVFFFRTRRRKVTRVRFRHRRSHTRQGVAALVTEATERIGNGGNEYLCKGVDLGTVVPPLHLLVFFFLNTGPTTITRISLQE